MALFKTHSIELFEEVEDAEQFGVNDYDEPNSGLISKWQGKGDFQPLSTSETLKTYGEFVQGTYKLYLDVDVEVKPDYKVKVEGYTNLFQVYGNPEVRKALIPHQKINLQYEGV